jgi:hypothetical protein
MWDKNQKNRAGREVDLLLSQMPAELVTINVTAGPPVCGSL